MTAPKMIRVRGQLYVLAGLGNLSRNRGGMSVGYVTIKGSDAKKVQAIAAKLKASMKPSESKLDKTGLVFRMAFKGLKPDQVKRKVALLREKLGDKFTVSGSASRRQVDFSGRKSLF